MGDPWGRRAERGYARPGVGRGPHQADRVLFAEDQLDGLREAVADLSWLLGRGYVEPSASKLVGDRYRLRQRQRVAVGRCAASHPAMSRRAARRRVPSSLTGAALAIDAFNLVIGLESALAGGVVLRGADGCLRDLASVHGSYRRVEVTNAAIAGLVQTIESVQPGSVTWYVDRPVSNSGRFAGWLKDAAPRGIGWAVELPYDADSALLDRDDAVVCTADAHVLDHATSWTDLLSPAVARAAPQAWLVDLSRPTSRGRA